MTWSEYASRAFAASNDVKADFSIARVINENFILQPNRLIALISFYKRRQ